MTTYLPQTPPVADIGSFLDIVLGQRAGLLGLAIGHFPYREENGRYTHRIWNEKCYQWPADREHILRNLAKANGDMYFCPALRSSERRLKDNAAASHSACWADLDGLAKDPALLEKLQPMSVCSGNPSHQHIYVPLTKEIDTKMLENINKRLAELLGGDSKWANNSLLRLPGTWNYKPTVPADGSTPQSSAPVWISGTTPRYWDPVELMIALELSYDGSVMTPTGAPPSAVPREPVTFELLPKSIRSRLDEEQPSDRSAAFQGLVNVCRLQGYSQGETLTIVSSWQPAQKYEGRLETELARSWSKAPTPTPTPTPPPYSTTRNGPSRPKLKIGSPAEMMEWLRENIGTGSLSGMFRRGTQIVHTPRINETGYVQLTKDQKNIDGAAQIQPLTADNITARVQYTYYWYKLVKDKPKGKDTKNADGAIDPSKFLGGEEVEEVKVTFSEEAAVFPQQAAKVVLGAPDLMPELRDLYGVIHTPIIREDGSLLSSPGYDDATGLLYLPEYGLSVPQVPVSPTAQDTANALSWLTTMVADFRFLTDHDRANYFGLLLTPLLREIIPPPYKLGAIGAPQPGSGKTLLANILRILYGGVLRSEIPADNAEFSKQIGAILDVTTGSVVQFDNVTGVLRSSVLAGLLTSNRFDDRRLGSQTMISRPNDRLWVITGNNLALGGDIPRRALRVTIDPGVPEPEKRTDFAIPQLERWAHEHRGELLGALLTLIRSWVVAGRPAERRGSGQLRRLGCGR